MELEKLRIFCAAAERGSFTGAAAELYISHSTVSRAVAELAHELGAELFRRARRGVEPTAAGQALLAGARALLADADALRESIRGMGGKI